MSTHYHDVGLVQFLLACFFVLFLKPVPASVLGSGWRRQPSILLFPEHSGSWRLSAVIVHNQLGESNGVCERSSPGRRGLGFSRTRSCGAWLESVNTICRV